MQTKADVSLKVENFDFVTKDKIIRKHGILFPSHIRCLIVGPSGSGKTNALLSLILNSNGLLFENIYLYSKSLYQPKYRFLKDILKAVKGVGYFEFSEQDDIIAVENAKCNSIFIFDDVPVSKKTNIIKEYFSRGRHRNIDSFFICQTYTNINKQLIRDNANLFIIFNMDLLNLKTIHRDVVSTDMNFETFINLCKHCWDESHGFLTICTESDKNHGRYRKGFDIYINITH